ncbi:MAG: matrixin family metalloprotease [Oligoflexales bacterium]
MKVLPILFMTVSMFTASQSWGGWVSSGGFLPTTDQNPWFIQNTKVVNYCVVVENELEFGTSKVLASKSITEALAYWKRQFATNPYEINNIDIVVGGQEFVEGECTESTDIVFQMGWLSPYQRNKIGFDRNKVMAVSVRTHYDEVNMRGKGFVYISPEKGSLAPRSEDAIERRWEINDGAVLTLTLIHEFGHIFGVPHMGTELDIMSETFVRKLIGPYGIGQDVTVDMAPNVFDWGRSFRACGNFGSFQGFIGDSGRYNCIGFDFLKNTLYGELDGAITILGKVKVESISYHTEVPVGTIVLPIQQKVYPWGGGSQLELYVKIDTSETDVKVILEQSGREVAFRFTEKSDGEVIVDGVLPQSKLQRELLNFGKWRRKP